MLKRVGKFISRSLAGLVGSLRDALEKLVQLPRNIKQACLLALDMVFVASAMWLAVAIRYGHMHFKLGPVEYGCAVLTVVLSAVVFLRLADTVLPGEVYRSAQPNPRLLRRWKEAYGIRTVVNLRGESSRPFFAAAVAPRTNTPGGRGVPITPYSRSLTCPSPVSRGTA